MNPDLQLGYIQHIGIDPSHLKSLLCESVLTYNVELFDRLLNYGERTDDTSGIYIKVFSIYVPRYQTTILLLLCSYLAS